MESTNQTRLPPVAHAHCDVFQAGLPWQGMAKLYKGSIFCHHGDTICHPKSCYVTTKLHGTSTCGCNNNAMFSGRAIFMFPTAVVCWPGFLLRISLAGTVAFIAGTTRPHRITMRHFFLMVFASLHNRTVLHVWFT